MNQAIGEVEAAVDQIAQNVEDKGLVTLLPPEKEQELENTAQQISDAMDSFKGVVEAVGELKQAIDRIPLVDLPQPDPKRVQATEENINSIRSGLDELTAAIRVLRQNASTEISKLSAAASNTRARIETSQENLEQIDNRLEALQNDVGQLKQRIPLYVTTVAVASTLSFVWITYAMIALIRQALSDLRREKEFSP